MIITDETDIKNFLLALNKGNQLAKVMAKSVYPIIVKDGIYNALSDSGCVITTLGFPPSKLSFELTSLPTFAYEPQALFQFLKDFRTKGEISSITIEDGLLSIVTPKLPKPFVQEFDIEELRERLAINLEKITTYTTEVLPDSIPFKINKGRELGEEMSTFRFKQETFPLKMYLVEKPKGYTIMAEAEVVEEEAEVTLGFILSKKDILPPKPKDIVNGTLYYNDEKSYICVYLNVQNASTKSDLTYFFRTVII